MFPYIIIVLHGDINTVLHDLMDFCNKVIAYFECYQVKLYSVDCVWHYYSPSLNICTCSCTIRALSSSNPRGELALMLRIFGISAAAEAGSEGVVGEGEQQSGEASESCRMEVISLIPALIRRHKDSCSWQDGA
jgi:hypothetical protein